MNEISSPNPWHDVSHQEWRSYSYPNGSRLHVVDAVAVQIMLRADGGEQHWLRIVGADGESTMFVTAGWLCCQWKDKPVEVIEPEDDYSVEDLYEGYDYVSEEEEINDALQEAGDGDLTIEECEGFEPEDFSDFVHPEN